MTLRPKGLFSAYRFVVRFPVTDTLVAVHSIFQDPFTGSLWMGRAHAESEPTLMQQLVEAVHLEVWLLPRHGAGGACRCLPVTCVGKPQWFPLDLDSGRCDVAMEWLCWSDCQVGGVGDPVRDVPAAVLPPSIRRAIDPRESCE